MMTPETAYNEATLKNLGDPNGTRMDVIYAALHIFRNELIDSEIEWMEEQLTLTVNFSTINDIVKRIEYLKKLKG